MKTTRRYGLSLLLATVAGSAAAAPNVPAQAPVLTPESAINASIRPSQYVPPARVPVRNAPLDPWNPKPRPLPAPAVSNHYAALVHSF